MKPLHEFSREKLQELLKTTTKKTDFQRVQCVWLRFELNMKAKLVAKITNLKPGTVRKIWAEYLKQGEESLLSKDRGGRRNYHLSKEEETMFLAPFLKKVEEDEGLVVEEVKLAYENMIGKSVPKSTIYRLLKRHGWQRRSTKKPPSQQKTELQTEIH